VRASGELLVYRFGAGLFFGNADVFRDDMRTIARVADGALKTVVINADALAIPDASARTALRRAQQELAARGIRMQLGNTREEVRRALNRIGGLDLIDEAQFLADLHRLHPSPFTPAPAENARTPGSGPGR
jgi:MFS superfamily sulfate permease-like transporter